MREREKEKRLGYPCTSPPLDAPRRVLCRIDDYSVPASRCEWLHGYIIEKKKKKNYREHA